VRKSTLDTLKKIVSSFDKFKNRKLVEKDLSFTSNTMQRYWNILKKYSMIEDQGFGVWQLNKDKVFNFFDKPHSSVVVSSSNNTSFPKDTCRSHAYQFTLPYSCSLLDDKKFRRKSLSKNKFVKIVRPFRNNRPDGNWWEASTQYVGEELMLNGWRVTFTPKSVSAQMSPDVSLFSQNSEDNDWEAISIWKRDVIKPLEKMFGKSLKSKLHNQFDAYKFKPSRKHHAMIKNDIARDYRYKGEKLKVFDADGYLWCLADSSFKGDELEFIKVETATKDHKQVGVAMLNSARDTKKTFHDVVQNITDINDLKGLMKDLINTQATTQNQLNYYAENIVTHVEYVKQGVETNKGVNRAVEKLTAVVSQINKPKVVEESSLDFLKRKITVKSMYGRYTNRIKALSDADKVDFSDWFINKFKEC